jgi:hypothetical protein
MTTAMMAEELTGLGLEFLLEDEQGELGYPALQATIYQPNRLTDKVIAKMDASEWIKVDGVAYERPIMALSESAYNSLDPEQAARLGAEFASSAFEHDGKIEEVLMAMLPASVRFVFLAKPKLFKKHKDSGTISILKKGDKMKALGCKTLSCALMALIVDGSPILTVDGTVQIFKLNLSSSKSALISGDKQFPEMRSLESLNKGLVEHYKSKGLLDAKAASKARLTHLVSVAIAPLPKVFTSADKESSVGIMFEMVGGAQPLPTEAQKLIHGLVSTDEFKAINNDPYGVLDKTKAEANPMLLDDAEELDFPA